MALDLYAARLLENLSRWKFQDFADTEGGDGDVTFGVAYDPNNPEGSWDLFQAILAQKKEEFNRTGTLSGPAYEDRKWRSAWARNQIRKINGELN